MASLLGNEMYFAYYADSPSVLHNVGWLLDCTWPAPTSQEKDATTYASGGYTQKDLGLKDIPNVVVKIKYDPLDAIHAALIAFASSREEVTFRHELACNTAHTTFQHVEYVGKVKQAKLNPPKDSWQELEVEVIYVSGITISTTPAASLIKP